MIAISINYCWIVRNDVALLRLADSMRFHLLGVHDHVTWRGHEQKIYSSTRYGHMTAPADVQHDVKRGQLVSIRAQPMVKYWGHEYPCLKRPARFSNVIYDCDQWSAITINCFTICIRISNRRWATAKEVHLTAVGADLDQCCLKLNCLRYSTDCIVETLTIYNLLLEVYPMNPILIYYNSHQCFSEFTLIHQRIYTCWHCWMLEWGRESSKLHKSIAVLCK